MKHFFLPPRDERFVLPREDMDLVCGSILRRKGFPLHECQLAAAGSMLRGRIAELPTGEGKTLAAVVSAVCYARMGRKVHIFTFNDYLALRDYQENRDIYEDCGVTAGCILEHTDGDARRRAYDCQVVYMTAKEAGFDFLRNFLCMEEKDLLPEKRQVCIVDEADSIMIDEARIPLVLAGEGKDEKERAQAAAEAVGLLGDGDMGSKEELRQVWLTDQGVDKVQDFFGIENLFEEEQQELWTLIHTALEARLLLRRDRDYLIKESRVFIIDPDTGRSALGRKFPDLLQMALERKEGVPVTCGTAVYNTIPMQYFLLRYETVCGMTGTARDAAAEFRSMYGLKVDVILPHIPCRRVDQPPMIFLTEAEKEETVAGEVLAAHERGRPVLLGTRSVEESERYARLLALRGVSCQVLNARDDRAEAEIIASAGRLGAVTVSTNMAGRGVDIRLGGGDPGEKEAVLDAGGLYVIGTGFYRNRRIDGQLRGRAGRQGDPGESRFFLSWQEPPLSRYPGKRRGRPQRWERIAVACREREEGKDAEARYILEKYAYILEEHRRRITRFREQILNRSLSPSFFREEDPIAFRQRVDCCGVRGVQEAERTLTLYFINLHWSRYLMTMENLRMGIHLMVIGGLSPVDEYGKAGMAAFREMEEEIRRDVTARMKTCRITENGVDLRGEGLAFGASTWTYMVNEDRNQFAALPRLLEREGGGVLFSLSGVVARLRRALGAGKKKTPGIDRGRR